MWLLSPAAVLLLQDSSGYYLGRSVCERCEVGLAAEEREAQRQAQNQESGWEVGGGDGGIWWMGRRSGPSVWQVRRMRVPAGVGVGVCELWCCCICVDMNKILTACAGREFGANRVDGTCTKRHCVVCCGYWLCNSFLREIQIAENKQLRHFGLRTSDLGWSLTALRSAPAQDQDKTANSRRGTAKLKAKPLG